MKTLPLLELNPVISQETASVELDAQEEQAASDTLNGQLQLLTEARSTIQADQRVGRDQVKFLTEECDLPLPERYPLNSFTEEPSPTNLAVSIETILERTKEVITLIVRKLGEFIKKAVSMVIKMLDTLGMYSRNYQRARQNLVRLVAVKASIEQRLRIARLDLTDLRTHATGLGAAGKSATLQAQADEIAKRWNDSWNDLTAHLLAMDRFYTSLRSIEVLLHDLIEQLKGKLVTMTDLVEDAAKSNLHVTDAADYQQAMSDISAIPLKYQAIMDAVRSWKPDFMPGMNEHNTHWSQVVSALAHEVDHMKQSKTSAVVNIDTACQLFTADNRTSHMQDNPAVAPLTTMKHSLTEMYAQAMKLAQIQLPDDPSGTATHHTSAAAQALMSDIHDTASGLIAHTILFSHEVLYQAVQTCAEYAKARINYMVASVQEKETTDPALYEALAPEIQKELTELRSSFLAINWEV